MMRHREVRGIRKIIPINSSGTGTTRSTYGTTGGSTYGTGSYGTSNGYSGGTSTGSGTTGSTGSTSSGTTGTTGGTRRDNNRRWNDPEIMQAALREPLDRQKERNK